MISRYLDFVIFDSLYNSMQVRNDHDSSQNQFSTNGMMEMVTSCGEILKPAAHSLILYSAWQIAPCYRVLAGRQRCLNVGILVGRIMV